MNSQILNRDISHVEESFKKYLLLKDTIVIRVVLATIFANRLEGDPLWLLIVAPPSSAKTEIINSLNGLPEIFPLSSLTAHTLVSGMITNEDGKKDDKDKSLILQLDGKILALKDFTSVLSMHREQRAEILSQLREIYDGAYIKRFGTGQVTDWKGKIGIIAGVTPIIDNHNSVSQMLGERFIQFRMESPDLVEMALRGIDNTGRECGTRQQLIEMVRDFAINIPMPTNEITIPSAIRNKIAHLAAFCVVARSGVLRDGRSREIIYTPAPEAPPRLAKQFVKLGQGLAVISKRSSISTEDYAVIYRIGLDIILKQRRDIIFLLEACPKSVKDIARITRYPNPTVYKILEDLRSLSLIDSSDEQAWSLTDSATMSLGEIKPFSETSGV
ncbi:MAG: hypothetical protein V1927_00550 [Candidatus Omnitrophota bacterium]